MGQPWGRLYTGTRNHRKISAIRRKHKDTWTYLYVLLECSFEADDEGKIYVNPNLPYSLEELADEIHFHKNQKFLKNLIETAVEVGLFSFKNQVPQWLSYSERQFKTDHSTAERVRKHREKQKSGVICNVPETLHANGSETDQIQIQIQTHNNTPPTPPGGSRKKKIKSNSYSEDFLKFWDAYPNRSGGMEEAWKSWQKKVKVNKLPPIRFLLEAVSTLSASIKWQENDGQFIPMITTFINQGRWTDAGAIKITAAPPAKLAHLKNCPRCRGSGTYQSGKAPDESPTYSPCNCEEVVNGKSAAAQ